MCNEYWWNDDLGGYEDENGTPVTQEQIDAVAELSHEIGIAVVMDHGCSSSSADTSDMEDVFQNAFRYALACEVVYHSDYNRPSPVGARYFDQDTRGENAPFQAGIWYQALETGLIVRNKGTISDAITFNGAPGTESIPSLRRH